jgi:hypothetical protein
MKRLVLIGFVVVAACTGGQPTQAAPTVKSRWAIGTDSPFVVVGQHDWGTWDIWTLRHSSGVCYTVLEPSGEGGGSLTIAPEAVCKTDEAAVEAK